MVSQTEETATPKVTSVILEKEGPIQRIIGYETRLDSIERLHRYLGTTGVPEIKPNFLNTTHVRTHLEILVDGEGVFPCTVDCVVGGEVVGQRILYRETTVVTDCRFYGKRFVDTKVTREIIPEDKNLPFYKAVELKSEEKI